MHLKRKGLSCAYSYGNVGFQVKIKITLKEVCAEQNDK